MKQNTASQRIVADIRAKIRAGALAPGDLVPSARQIVRDKGVALATATKVLALLRREGLVRSKAGVGTVVLGERAPDLSRERIVAAALAIADDDGTDTLSMRTLARELGVATMSLYRHVRSRDELMALMVDAVFAEQHLPRFASQGWRARLEAIARLQWESYGRHPWIAHQISMTRPQVTRNGMRHTEAVLAAIAPLGLGDAETLQTGVAFIAYVRGMAASLEAENRAQQDTGMTPEEWMNANEAAFASQMGEMPQLTRLSSAPDVDMGLEALFECGLRCWLDGLAARASRRSG